jgi:hypothetical protein
MGNIVSQLLQIESSGQPPTPVLRPLRASPQLGSRGRLARKKMSRCLRRQRDALTSGGYFFATDSFVEATLEALFFGSGRPNDRVSAHASSSPARMASQINESLVGRS